jgi:hypothetical protein
MSYSGFQPSDESPFNVVSQRDGTGDVTLVSKRFMEWRFAFSLWRVSAVVFALLLPTAPRSVAYQPPVPQSAQVSADELNLTAAEENDSYEIYSMLLRTEMPPQWNIKARAIETETQTFPTSASNDGTPGSCLEPPQDQKSIYQPLIENYAAKNKTKLVLKRKFDLSQYALVGPEEIKSIRQRSRSASGFPFNATVVFHVSALGFDRDRTRALVYVGHNCGDLCGGGGYHFLMKRNGQWQVDREYRGLVCVWAS